MPPSQSAHSRVSSCFVLGVCVARGAWIMPRLFCGTSLTSTCLDSPHKVSWKARALDSTSAHPKGLSPRAVPKGLQDRDIADFSTCFMSVASPAFSEAAAAPNVALPDETNSRLARHPQALEGGCATRLRKKPNASCSDRRSFMRAFYRTHVVISMLLSTCLQPLVCSS